MCHVVSFIISQLSGSDSYSESLDYADHTIFALVSSSTTSVSFSSFVKLRNCSTRVLHLTSIPWLTDTLSRNRKRRLLLFLDKISLCQTSCFVQSSDYFQIWEDKTKRDHVTQSSEPRHESLVCAWSRVDHLSCRLTFSSGSQLKLLSLSWR